MVRHFHFLRLLSVCERMTAATTAAHSAKGHMLGNKLRQESLTMDMLEVGTTGQLTCYTFQYLQLKN